jgi:hypothetical protein
MSNVAEKRQIVLASAARTATATSSAIQLSSDATDVGICVVTTAFTSGTFTAKLQHSLDGVKWEDVPGAVSSAIGAVGQETDFASTAVLPMVRVVLTGASTPIATQYVAVIYG